MQNHFVADERGACFRSSFNASLMTESSAGLRALPFSMGKILIECSTMLSVPINSFVRFYGGTSCM